MMTSCRSCDGADSVNFDKHWNTFISLNSFWKEKLPRQQSKKNLFVLLIIPQIREIFEGVHAKFRLYVIQTATWKVAGP